ncbi:MAG TPA: hypothetical protein VHO03_16690 [Ignavibacteriales bacterium]|nr:hypothetical protein [Ignavibacteriales bacterium]
MSYVPRITFGEGKPGKYIIRVAAFDLEAKFPVKTIEVYTGGDRFRMRNLVQELKKESHTKIVKRGLGKYAFYLKGRKFDNLRKFASWAHYLNIKIGSTEEALPYNYGR